MAGRISEIAERLNTEVAPFYETPALRLKALEYILRSELGKDLIPKAEELNRAVLDHVTFDSVQCAACVALSKDMAAILATYEEK